MVEHDARDRDGPEVVHRVGLEHVAHGRRVLRLQRPRDEGGEAAGPLLERLDTRQVLEALGERLTDAVHHGDRGLHPLFVGDAHDLEPPVGARLLRRCDVPHALDEDLAAAPRDRVEPGGLQLAHDRARVDAEQRREEVDFAWGKAVDMDRVIPLDVTQQIQIPVQRDIRIVSALDQDLHAAQRLGLLDLLPDLLERQRVPFPVLGPPRERAEAAIGHAHVRVVDVAVNDEGDRVVRVLLAPDAVGLCAQLEEGRVRVEVEQVARGGRHGGVDQAGRKAKRPSGTRPAVTRRRKNSVSPARCL